MIKAILKLINKFSVVNNLSKKEQKAIIDSFPEPANDYERVEMNHKCSKKMGFGIMNIVYDIIGILVIPILLVIYLVNTAKIVREPCKKAIIILSGNRNGDSYSLEERMPHLKEVYGEVSYLKTGVFPHITGGAIDGRALIIYFRFLMRHPFSGFMNLRCLINIMGYNRLLLKYSPKAIITARAELNLSSSLVTLLCESHDAEFVNFMHGEMTTNISVSFVRFSKFYIWDEHYIDVFMWSRCAKDQYVIYKPDIYKVKKCGEIAPEFYLTYYFCGNEKDRHEKNIEKIREILMKFTEDGKKCKVRPHPRWSDLDEIRDTFGNTDIIIEYPGDISVSDSISNSELVVGTFSTVLTEAYYMGKTVVIDNVSNPLLYSWLQESKYFLVSKNTKKLSDML